MSELVQVFFTHLKLSLGPAGVQSVPPSLVIGPEGRRR